MKEEDFERDVIDVGEKGEPLTFLFFSIIILLYKNVPVSYEFSRYSEVECCETEIVLTALHASTWIVFRDKREGRKFT